MMLHYALEEEKCPLSTEVAKVPAIHSEGRRFPLQLAENTSSQDPEHVSEGAHVNY